MKTLKILTMMIWLFLLSYIPIKIGIDRNLTFYFILFPIALVGVLFIQYLFDKNKPKNSQNT